MASSSLASILAARLGRRGFLSGAATGLVTVACAPALQPPRGADPLFPGR